MNKVILKVVEQKKSDRKIQIIMACVAIGLAPFTMLFSLFLLGLTHAISTIFWMFNQAASPIITARKGIQIINVAILIIGIGTLTVDFEHFLQFSTWMIAVGGILGTIYFIITTREISYYQRLLNS